MSSPKETTGVQVTLADPRARPQLRQLLQFPAHLLELRHAAEAAAGALEVVESHEFQDQTSPRMMEKWMEKWMGQWMVEK